MKKLFSVLAAVCLVFAVAGNAAAAFTYASESSLGLSTYNLDSNEEIGYDLGLLGVDFTLADQDLLLGNIDTSDPAMGVALYSSNSTWQSFVGTNNEYAPVISGSGIILMQGATREIFATYGDVSPATVAGTANGGKTASNYFADGAYAGLLTGGYGMASLASLAIDGQVDIYLYQYDGNTLNTGFDAATDYAAMVSIFDNGDVVLNAPSAVPVPAAVWLLGSGLLGLIGIRRKNA
ncbi:hypothetical protein DSCA_22960 [Desulfosarcina alkanivorans]|uniref:PEP-CTERM protein-sorting domain-containing protein n=1 Tax=Desulfosarcina alkanivorans TaxID=571177 RepID=A0A5K7YGX2_9BACT|nr:VPLPA-CTERM sorting domain-containing protein [Desulfosarcina alkanivorans]BBO68366.1 hypothetical protein DSCA_22960 [Desulfosarcina alkanivorans]